MYMLSSWEYPLKITDTRGCFPVAVKCRMSSTMKGLQGRQSQDQGGGGRSHNKSHGNRSWAWSWARGSRRRLIVLYKRKEDDWVTDQKRRGRNSHIHVSVSHFLKTITKAGQNRTVYELKQYHGWHLVTHLVFWVED